MKPVEERIRAALSAGEEELRLLITDPHPEVISNAVLNRSLSEDMAVYIAKRKTATAETLTFLAGDVRFKDSYKLRAAICRNPRTPQRVTLSLLKFMRIFDLSDIANDQRINIVIRQKIEYIISERLPSMPSGVMTALARKTNPSMLLRLVEHGDEKVVSACLDSPMLTETHVCRAVNGPAAGSVLVRLVCEHAKWSLRYSVRYALIRNFHTPTMFAAEYISGMKTSDLQDLYSDTKTPLSSKPFIYRELLNRGEGTEPGPDEVHELDEDGHL